MEVSKLEVAELQHALSVFRATLVSQADGYGQIKTIDIVASGGLQVTHNGDVVWQGIQPFDATEKYNEIEL
jgi:hypothetical protein